MRGNAERGKLSTASTLQAYAQRTHPRDGARMPLALARALHALIRPDAHVLEIGMRCRPLVAQITPHYLGLDDDLARVASARAQGWDVRELAVCSPLPVLDATCDVVLAISCDGSAEELRWVLLESWRVLRPGGVLLVSVPQTPTTRQPRKILNGPGASPWLDAADLRGIRDAAASGWTVGTLRGLLASEGYAAQTIDGYDAGTVVPLRHEEAHEDEGRLVAARLLAVALKGGPGAPERARLRSA